MTSSSNLDHVLGFTIPRQHARGRLVRLGPVLQEILANHGYPPPIEKLLAEALALTALLGSTLKDAGGQLTLQAQTEGGVVDLLVCDYMGGQIRGYVKHDPDRLAQAPVDPTLFALFGKGYLAITFDQVATKERYQGIVPLEGASLAEAAQSFFSQSEQIPSLVRLAVAHDKEGGCIAGGILVQHLPEGEEGRDRLHTRLDHPEWEHVEALARTVSPAELTDPALPLSDLVWMLFHDSGEVRVLVDTPLAKGCRCNPDYIAEVLARFPAEERADMADEDGIVRVDCAFCAQSFPIALAAVES